jgi:hypothetical protein
MEPSLDRRRHADRRRHPTTLWSTLRWQGRRTSFRRAGEGHQAYVDSLARQTVVLALKIGVTGVAVWVLAAHQQWSLAVRGLYGLALGYGVVLVSHVVLCVRWV